MDKLRLHLLLIVSALFFFHPAMASHLAGQDFTYIAVDSAGGMYHYRVTLVIYQDCIEGSPIANEQDNPAFFSVFTGQGDIVQIDSFVYYSASTPVPITSSGPCNTGGVALCRNKLTFSKDFYLRPSTSGYNIVYQRCCLNVATNLFNPDDQGMAAMCSIPPSGLAAYNNSAVFSSYPPFIISYGTPFSVDCSATDADGDSLSYELCTPYAYTNQAYNAKPLPPYPPPFIPVAYFSPFTFADPLDCSVPLAIDPHTGMLTGTPAYTGTYFIGICCHEWRHGVLINTVQRTFEFTVVSCTPGADGPSVDITMYPNPVIQELFIEVSNEQIIYISITDVLGRAVYSQTEYYDKAQVDMTEFPAGMYFVKVNGSNVRKVIKG